MEYSLFDFQEEGITEISKQLQTHNSVLAVSPTGSGKAVILSAISQRFVSKSSKDVIIFVHKKELLEQTRKTLFEWHNIISQKIDAKTTSIDPSARVFVAMVETFSRRSDSLAFLDKFTNIGLLIIDEAHLNSFTKIMVHFATAKRIGFTATPISAVKKDPMNKRWGCMVTVATTEQLIQLNEENPLVGVVKCACYAPENIDRSQLKMKGDDFDEDFMGKEFSKKKHIQNAVDCYLKLGYGRRSLIFNANIKHSIEVYEAFKELGLNVRHLDSEKSGKYGGDAYREECLKWLAETPDGILCNVGILTTGFDLKTIEFIMLNKSTTSVSLLFQILGRGMRACVFPDGTIKYECIFADMGGNLISMKINPNLNYDWETKFHTPYKPSNGVSPIKFCPECGAMNSCSARICLAKVDIPILDIEGECGYIFPVAEVVEDLVPKEMVRLFQDKISVKQAIEVFKDKSEWASYYNVLDGIVILAKQEIGVELEEEQLSFVFDNAIQKAREWFKLQNRNVFKNFKEGVADTMCKKLQLAGFNLDLEMIEKVKSTYKKSKVGITI